NRQDCDGRHVLGNFVSRHSVSSISLARHVLCASVQPGRVAVREDAEETAPDPWSAFTSSILTTLVAPVIGTMTSAPYVDKIIKGANPSQFLPVEQLTRLQMVLIGNRLDHSA